MCALLILILLLCVLLLAVLHRHYNFWRRRGIPQLRPHYVLGNVPWAAGGNVQLRQFNQQLYTLHKHSGQPYAGMYIFFTRAALILDLDVVRDICIRNFSTFQDRGVFSNARDDPLTGHLFRLEGEQWRAMRNKLTPVFSAGNMKYMFPTVVDVGAQLVDACAVAMREASGSVVELKELCARYTTDVIGRCAFGLECDSLRDSQAEFRQRGSAVFGQPRHSSLVQTFMLMNPSWARKLRMKFFPDDVIDFYVDVVRQTVEQRQRSAVRHNDFMDLLIALKATDERVAARSDGIDLSQGLTLHQMVAQAFVFFVAGFETSSTTMSLCLYELALNASIQERVRTEVEEVLQRHKLELSYEALHEMHYLDQCIDETLRKYPVVPYLVRRAKVDYQVPNSNHIIEKGCSVVLPAHAIHHDPEIYAAPEKFDPSRFDPASHARHPAAYLPFGQGPRSCIGMRFGKMQVKVGLINLLRHYRFSRTTRTEVPLSFNERIFQIMPAGGIYLHVEAI